MEFLTNCPRLKRMAEVPLFGCEPEDGINAVLYWLHLNPKSFMVLYEHAFLNKNKIDLQIMSEARIERKARAKFFLNALKKSQHFS